MELESREPYVQLRDCPKKQMSIVWNCEVSRRSKRRAVSLGQVSGEQVAGKTKTNSCRLQKRAADVMSFSVRHNNVSVNVSDSFLSFLPQTSSKLNLQMSLEAHQSAGSTGSAAVHAKLDHVVPRKVSFDDGLHVTVSQSRKKAVEINL